MLRFLSCFLIIGLCLSACQPAPAPIGWSTLDPEHSPPPSAYGGVAYDNVSGKAILFGGITMETWLDETWTWDGRDWEQLTPANHPPAREKPGMAYDEVRKRIVLFGGTTQDTLFNDTWEWDGSDWHQLDPAHRPPARCCHAMAYDNVSQGILLYGGWDSGTNTFLNDTWLWDGTDWAELSCCDAPQMSGHAMVTFSNQEEIIAMMTADWGTWSWNGIQWRNLRQPGPPSRSSGWFAYDSDNHRAIFFGGHKDDQFLNDTWVFDGIGWSELSLLTQPPPRYGHIMFYDTRRQTTILFGGVGTGKENWTLGDTWELNLPKDLDDIAVTPTAQP